jgi:hypothetical protein
MTKLSKVPWNLSVRSDIKRAMEVHCALSGQEISEITEQLWRELLKREGTSTGRTQTRPLLEGEEKEVISCPYSNLTSVS